MFFAHTANTIAESVQDGQKLAMDVYKVYLDKLKEAKALGGTVLATFNEEIKQQINNND